MSVCEKEEKTDEESRPSTPGVGVSTSPLQRTDNRSTLLRTGETPRGVQRVGKGRRLHYYSERESCTVRPRR